jgi:hypothetical protein
MTDADTTSSTSIIAASKAARLSLTPRQQAFVEAYARPGTVNGRAALNASEAARRAGYSHRRADSTAQHLLRIPKVKAAVELIRKEVAELASYSLERCMAELEKGMAFAHTTENASAYVRAVELRGKLAGLIVDRMDARLLVGQFSITVEGLVAGGDRG